MNINQLRELTDNELNKLSATKIMGFNYRGYCEDIPSHPYVSPDPNGDIVLFTSNGYRKWNPATDMNDIADLQSSLNDEELHSYTLRLMKMVSAFGHITYQDVTNILKASARERTIAAILSKG